MTLWITLLLAIGLFAQTPQNEPFKEDTALASVTGRVIDSESKRPIIGAKVSMLALWKGKNGTTTSDQNGEFHFDKVAAGKYMFEASAEGYRSDPLPQPDISGDAKLSVEIALIRESGIEGRVVDDESRKPLAGITVRAFLERRDFGSQRVMEFGHKVADKDGEYAFLRVPPGKYFLVAEPAPADHSRKRPAGESHPVPTWLPDALRRSDAVPVYVTAGHYYDGSDIHLRKAAGYAVSGVISGLPETTDRQETTVRLAADGDALYGERTAIPDGQGRFSFAGVLPGKYTALLLRRTIDKRRVATHLFAFEDVLVEKSDVKDLRLSVHWPIAISGSVKVDDSPDADLKGMYLALAQTDGIVSAGWPSAELKEDGAFEFPTCDPIRYQVMLRQPPAGTYVRSITFNHREALPSDIIDASHGGGKLEIFLHKGGAELSGSVEMQTGTEAANSDVRVSAVLIPADWSPDWAIELPSARIEKGSFSILNVRPGTYSAVAMEGPEELWRNPGLVREMQSRGETVTLSEDDHISVQLKLVTAREVQQAARAAEQ